MPRIWLASRSPRRGALLEQIGVEYDVIRLREADGRAPDVVERFKEVVLLPGDKPMSPAEYTKFIGDFATLWAGVSKSAGIELELG